MGFYWNIMMYECEVEYKGYFFSCFSIFNERYFTFTNSFKAFAPPTCELNLATPTHASGFKYLLAFSFESTLPSTPPPELYRLVIKFHSRSEPGRQDSQSKSKLFLYVFKNMLSQRRGHIWIVTFWSFSHRGWALCVRGEQECCCSCPCSRSNCWCWRCRCRAGACKQKCRSLWEYGSSPSVGEVLPELPSHPEHQYQLLAEQQPLFSHS